MKILKKNIFFSTLLCEKCLILVSESYWNYPLMSLLKYIPFMSNFIQEITLGENRGV